MTKKMIKIVAIPTVAVMLTVPAVGQFGIPGLGGLPVSDAGVQINQMLQYVRMFAQLQEMIALVEKATQTYNEAKRQALALKGLGSTYKAPRELWRGLSAGNLSGKTAGWVQAANSRINPGGAYNATVEPYFGYSNMSSIPSSQQGRRMQDIASLDLADGVSAASLDAIGSSRVQGPATEQALQRIESDVLSESDAMQVQAVNLQKANAIKIIQAREMASQTKLLVAQTELALLNLRAQRQAEARALNSDIAFKRDGLTAVQATYAGASDAMMAFRIP